MATKVWAAKNIMRRRLQVHGVSVALSLCPLSLSFGPCLSLFLPSLSNMRGRRLQLRQDAQLAAHQAELDAERRKRLAAEA